MRHRKRGRVLGRSPSHRKALLKNLASALILTERDAEDEANAPKVKGRIVTTLHKAKEVRPLVEKCVTIARDALDDLEQAGEHGTQAERNSEEWKQWRKSERWSKWAEAMAPAVNARRRLIRLLGDKKAVKVLVDDIAPRFKDREGGYTRIVKLAKPRLGDAGARALLEFVGVRDRVVEKSQKPAFGDEESTETAS
ncbi:MAG TPA: L17 family ribosomal protein [Pirellulaceae bacterium]|nr:L17 family ribosomal protein [Pirellulaceae bacterium]